MTSQVVIGDAGQATRFVSKMERNQRIVRISYEDPSKKIGPGRVAQLILAGDPERTLPLGSVITHALEEDATRGVCKPWKRSKIELHLSAFPWDGPAFDYFDIGICFFDQRNAQIGVFRIIDLSLEYQFDLALSTFSFV